MPQILLHGATGFTGRLVAHELDRLGLSFRLAGRNKEKLEALQNELKSSPPFSVADITNPASLDGMIQGMRVVINTVGPFTDLGEPVFAAAMEQGVHYLDTTGEQEFMRNMAERYHEQACERGSAAVCAHAFEYALGDCAASLAAASLGSPVEQINVFYKVPTFSTSRGTSKSILRAIVQKGVYWTNGAWKKEGPIGASKKIEIDGKQRVALSFAGGEAAHVPTHTGADHVRSYMCFSPKVRRKIRMSTPLIPLLKFGWMQRMADRRIDKQPVGPDEEIRAKQHFVIIAQASSGEETKTCTVRGVDPYGLTARLVALGAKKLVEDRPGRVGVVSSAMCFDPTEVLQDLASDGLTWQID